MNRSRSRVWAAIVALAFVAGVSWCAETPPRDLDRQLLEGLESRAADDLDRELFGPAKTRHDEPPKGKAENRANGVPNLGMAGVSESDNPLIDVARQMREAERLIAQASAGGKTQDLQEEIVARLEELLRKARKQCGGGQCQPGECKTQKVAPRDKTLQPKPAAKPTAKSGQERPKERTKKNLDPTKRAQERPTLGQNRDPDPVEREATVKGLWGSLPEREREQMMKLLPPEQFLPKYEFLIEEYFRRLTDDRGAARPSSPPTP